MRGNGRLEGPWVTVLASPQVQSLPLGSQVLGLLQSALCFSPVHLATESPAEPEPVVPPSAVVKRGKTRGENLPQSNL